MKQCKMENNKSFEERFDAFEAQRLEELDGMTEDEIRDQWEANIQEQMLASDDAEWQAHYKKEMSKECI